MKHLLIVATLIASSLTITAPAMAATTLYTVKGTGSGSLDGASFTNSGYVLSFTADDRSNMPTETFFQLGNGSRVTLNILTAFGTAFDRFYVQNLSSRFKNDLFNFTLPDAQMDIYAPFPIVTGTNVTALGGFRDIGTTGGALTLSSSSSVQFQAITAVAAAVPEPAIWAMMLFGFGGIGFAMRRHKRNVTTTVAYA